MSLLSRLFGRPADVAPRALYDAIVAEARQPQWYAQAGVTDSLEGRFDLLSAVLALVMLRLEREGGQERASVALTEIFVSDMDGQLRNAGVGDLGVGKRMGKLMAALGGRLGAYRAALLDQEDSPLREAVVRNMTLNEGTDPGPVTASLRALADSIAAVPLGDLLAGKLAAVTA